MSHLVIFKNSKNATAFHQASSLEDAVRFMEHLRNTERVEHAKLFKLHEVNFEFRPYFKVEVGQGAPAAAGGTPEPDPEPEVDEDEVEAVDELEPVDPESEPRGPKEREPVGVGSRKGLFGR